MNKVLLIGDIELNHSDLYHVGDEAALNEVVRRLQNEIPDISISKYSGPVPAKEQSLVWIKQITNTKRVPAELAQIVSKSNILWLVGGGNLNSLFPEYLYHRVALILAAKSLGKFIVATSQTIGPFNEGDREIFYLGAKEVNYLSIRDQLDSADELKDLGLRYAVSHDDATLLPCKKRKFCDKLHVGISSRDWDSSLTVKKTRTIMAWLGLNLQLHLIPHIIDSQNSFDVDFMKRHFPGIAYDYSYFKLTGERFDQEVKSLTSSMDILITTRYHGAIFATSENIKCIALFEGEYYRRKMQGLESLKVPNLLVIDVEKRLSRKKISDFFNSQLKELAPPVLPKIEKILSSGKV